MNLKRSMPIQLGIVLVLAIASLESSALLPKKSLAALDEPAAAPAHVAALAISVDQIELSWASPTAFASVTGYAIQRNDTLLATVNSGARLYVDTSVQPSTTYTYTVAAVDALGQLAPASTPTAVTTPALPETPDLDPPTSPESLIATDGAGAILLDWYDASDNSDVTAYVVRRDGKKLATVNSGTLSYSDTAILPTTPYSYTVEAIDVLGHHSPSSNLATVLTSVFKPDSPPDVPTGLSATAVGDRQVALRWNAAADAAALAGYAISRNGTPLVTLDGGTLSYTDTVTLPAIAYAYTIEAIDTHGQHSAPSNPVVIPTPMRVFLFLPLVKGMVVALNAIRAATYVLGGMLK
jgi:large repetitive protein